MGEGDSRYEKREKLEIQNWTLAVQLEIRLPPLCSLENGLFRTSQGLSRTDCDRAFADTVLRFITIVLELLKRLM